MKLTCICNFLGLDYSALMLEYADKSTYDPPDRPLCYQWKTKYTEREERLVEGKTGKMILDRRYEPSVLSPISPGNFELIKL